jgi:hypothetical protein
MTSPIDAAFAVLKADPRMQLFRDETPDVQPVPFENEDWGHKEWMEAGSPYTPENLRQYMNYKDVEGKPGYKRLGTVHPIIARLIAQNETGSHGGSPVGLQESDLVGVDAIASAGDQPNFQDVDASTARTALPLQVRPKHPSVRNWRDPAPIRYVSSHEDYDHGKPMWPDWEQYRGHEA